MAVVLAIFDVELGQVNSMVARSARVCGWVVLMVGEGGGTLSAAKTCSDLVGALARYTVSA